MVSKYFDRISSHIWPGFKVSLVGFKVMLAGFKVILAGFKIILADFKFIFVQRGITCLRVTEQGECKCDLCQQKASKVVSRITLMPPQKRVCKKYYGVSQNVAET